MLDFTVKIKELKKENEDLINFRISFNETNLFLEGEWIDNGVSEGFYTAGNLAYFYIPTNKGYVSAEWKKTDFFSNGFTENVDSDFINLLEPFLQEKKPTVFIRKTEISVASVIANHINSKVDYLSNKMVQ